MLKPVQRALARQGCGQPPQERAEQGIVAQLVMVDQVLVAQAQAEHPLTHQGAHVMHRPGRIATIHKAAGETIQQAYGLVGGRQQHRACIRRQPPAIESAHNFTPAGLSQIQRIWDTLLGHRGTPANGHLFVAEELSLILSPYATRPGEKSGLVATVITHSPSIAVELVEHPNVAVELIGGRLFKHSVVAVGATAIEAIARVRADTYFMGVTGIHPDIGLTTGDPEEAAVKRALSQHAAETVVLASREKLGAASPFVVVPMSEVGTVIVEADTPEAVVAPYRAASVAIIFAQTLVMEPLVD